MILVTKKTILLAPAGRNFSSIQFSHFLSAIPQSNGWMILALQKSNIMSFTSAQIVNPAPVENPAVEGYFIYTCLLLLVAAETIR